MSEHYAALLSAIITSWLCYFAAKLRLRIGGLSMYCEPGMVAMRDISAIVAIGFSAVGVGVLLFKIFTSY